MTGNAGLSRGRRLEGRDTFECLARAGRFRNEETAEHVERMSRTCLLVGEQLGWTAGACDELRAASSLHDIGKIGIPERFCSNPDR